MIIDLIYHTKQISEITHQTMNMLIQAYKDEKDVKVLFLIKIASHVAKTNCRETIRL